MALPGKLGFGMMRLPVLGDDPTNFDYEQIYQMVDTFLDNGFTYFDTSHVYHNGKSEEAVRKAVVERHPRDSFTIATKLPVFDLTSEDQVEPVFNKQLKTMGVDYVDYYLLHNIQTFLYDGVDGKGGVMQSMHLFDHAKKWKEEGRIKHLGISFHSSAKLLDRILTEHPEIEFVQIVINYYDWESGYVQAHKCYDTIRKHGKKVVIMEPVKGGLLSRLPEQAANSLHERDANASNASWALRFAGSLDDVIAVLSGMSTLAQVQDNVNTFCNAAPLSPEDLKTLQSVVAALKDEGPVGEAGRSRFEGVTYCGVPVVDILDAYTSANLKGASPICCDPIYLRNSMAEATHTDLLGKLPEERIIANDGEDVTEQVMEAVRYLAEHFSGGSTGVPL